ncbi:hypothetical protein [Asanoa ferruginea]|nr:hypothetical protein [Asanoa ferruginea]
MSLTALSWPWLRTSVASAVPKPSTHTAHAAPTIADAQPAPATSGP